MNSEEWQRLSDVMDGALAQPSDTRQDWLRSACADSPALLARAQELLAKESEAFSGISDHLEAVRRDAGEGAIWPEDIQPDREGALVGGYRLANRIGRGGMGEVYAANDPRLGRQVAIKLLSQGVTNDPTRVTRFEQEARAASALNHPNIVTIYDFGSSDGLYYITTELVSGKTLRQIIVAGQPPILDIVDFSIQIASALAAAHHAGIIHRDVKPENIMVRPDGYVKVLDFGLAKLRPMNSDTQDPDSSLTRPGTVMGTIRYMSPEQARGLEVDGRSDIFSLGAVLYELATGKQAFAGDSPADVISAVLLKEPAPVSDVRPDAPNSLQRIVVNCLQKRPEDRYSSCEALMADLRTMRLELNSGRGPVTMLASRWHSRHVVGLFLLTVILVLAAIATWWNPLHREASWFQTSQFARVPTDDKESFGAISPGGHLLAFLLRYSDQRLSLGIRPRHGSVTSPLFPPRNAVYWAFALSPDEKDLYYTEDVRGSRELGNLYRISVAGGKPTLIAERVRGAYLSHDGLSVCFIRGRAGDPSVLMFANADGSEPREIVHSSAAMAFYTVAWSADDRELYYSEGNESQARTAWHLWNVRRDGTNAHIIVDLGLQAITTMIATPDASGLIVNAPNLQTRTPQIWHLTFKGVWRPITHDFNEYYGLTLTKDGKEILTNSAFRESVFWTFDATNPSPGSAITDSQYQLYEPVWTYGGTIVGRRGLAESWSLWASSPDGSSFRRLTNREGVDETEPSACPDRDDLVFASRTAGVRNIWRLKPETGDLQQLTFGTNDRHPQCLTGGRVTYRWDQNNQTETRMVSIDTLQQLPVDDIQWSDVVSPDGLFKAVTLDKESHAIINRKTGDSVVILPAGLDHVAWSPDSRGVAYPDISSGTAEVWFQPVDGGAPRQMTHLGGKSIFWLNWSPDGRRLICAVGRVITQAVSIVSTQ